MLKRCRLVIAVPSLDRSAEFYRDKLAGELLTRLAPTDEVHIVAALSGG